MSPADEALLDNPAYSALCGPHARLALVRGRARRYPVDVAPFLGLPSPPSPQDWRDAADLVTPGTFAGVRYGDSELPDGWQVVDTFDLVQMIGERITGVDCSEAIPLGAADVPEMLELVAATEPGPFLTRTIELAKEAGLLKGELVAAQDSSPVIGRGAVKDTYNLLGDAIRKLVRGLAQAQGEKPLEVAKRYGIEELAFSQLVFATDYPQAVREASDVAAYVRAVRALGTKGYAVAGGANAEKLIPNVKQRLTAHLSSPAKAPA